MKIHTKKATTTLLSLRYMTAESGLTHDLESVGKQDDFLGGSSCVGPVTEQRPREETAEAERRQGQTQEVRGCV